MKPILFFSAVSILSASTLPTRHEFNTLQGAPPIKPIVSMDWAQSTGIWAPPVPPFNKLILPPGGPDVPRPTPVNTPEPGTMATLGIGVTVIGLAARKKRV